MRKSSANSSWKKRHWRENSRRELGTASRFTFHGALLARAALTLDIPHIISFDANLDELSAWKRIGKTRERLTERNSVNVNHRVVADPAARIWSICLNGAADDCCGTGSTAGHR